MRLVTLHHFTSTYHLPMILESGYIATTENNIARPKFIDGTDVNAGRGPGVVWLSTAPELTTGIFGLELSSLDKTQIRITVEVPAREVHKWNQWAMSRGIDKQWMQQLLSRCPGHRKQRIVTRRICSDEWTEVVDMHTGAHYAIPLISTNNRRPQLGGPDIQTVLTSETVSA